MIIKKEQYNAISNSFFANNCKELYNKIIEKFPELYFNLGERKFSSEFDKAIELALKYQFESKKYFYQFINIYYILYHNEHIKIVDKYLMSKNIEEEVKIDYILNKFELNR